MTAKIIDGKAAAADIRAELKHRVDALVARGIRPGLTVILVGENPASRVYVRNKAKSSEELGMRSELVELPADTPEADLIARIHALNADPAVHGILVQLPLPATIHTQRVLEAISPAKDVDGFHYYNVGALVTGHPIFMPCTPYGVMKLLERESIPLWGQYAVVVGASNIVGKPMAMLMLQKGATVTICNSKTKDLAYHTRQADVLVLAVGRPNMITGDMIKPGATVIDVGINRLPDGKLAGDVDFESARKRAGWITPVPGGVGPMTVTMLLVNTVEAAERGAGSR